MTPFRGRTSRVLLAAACSSILAVSACGSSDSDGGGDSSGAASPAKQECIDKANDFLKDWTEFPTTLPESPPARYTKLDEKPKAGTTITFMVPNIPAARTSFEGAQDAAKALNWTVKAVNYDGTVPDINNKLDGVIQQKPDFIATTGLPTAAFQAKIAEGKKAGITFLSTSTNDDPVEIPGFGGSGNTVETAKTIGDIHAYKALADSNCTANSVVFTLDFPVLKTSEDEYKKVIEENCDDCKVDVVTIQLKDIGTPNAAQQMVSKLQASPKTKYAYTIIGDVATGLQQGLKTAGVEDVRIFGQVPNATSIADLRNGTNAWWVNQSSYINGIDTVDLAVRILATGEPQGDPGGYPLALLTKDNVPDGEDAPVIPENVLDLYKESWNLG